MAELPIKVQKYLSKYSLPNWSVKYNNKTLFNNIVVIPSICEYENIKKLLGSLIELNDKYFSTTLFLFVINNKKDDSEEIKTNNKKTLIFLRQIINDKKDETLKKIILSGLNIGVIDASSRGNELPNKVAGVGLARKIGMDCALKLFDHSSKKKKIFICLDADCTVSKNYLTEIVDAFNNNNINCASIRYEHNIKNNDEETKAIICYEIFLRYYHLGLLFANSPYAFATIGSAMACDAESYMHIEGMNKKKAAEDFYFLEKLSKSFDIKEINNAIVYPSARKSWRVPFGTGQRVGRFLSNEKDEYLLHNPKCFEILKKCIFLLAEENNVQTIMSKAKNISLHLYKFLVDKKFIKVMDGIIKNSKTKGQIHKQKIKWFDGFKTLKLIHYLRDNVYLDINMFDALDEMFEKLNIKFETNRQKGTILSIDIQKKYLIEMRNYLYG